MAIKGYKANKAAAGVAETEIVEVEVSQSPKPYSKSRPPYKNGQVEDVWENSKQADGNVYDPNTGEQMFWDKSKLRRGQWDMGHKPGMEYRKLHQDYMSGKISKTDFIETYQNPNNYQAELLGPNRSGRYEQK